MKDFEPFYVQLRGENAHSGRIAARSRHAGCKPATNEVVGHRHDGDRPSRMLRRTDGLVAEGDDEIDILRDKLSSKCFPAFAAALRPNELEAYIASLIPADRLHVAPEGLSEGLKYVLPIGP